MTEEDTEVCVVGVGATDVDEEVVSDAEVVVGVVSADVKVVGSAVVVGAVVVRSALVVAEVRVVGTGSEVVVVGTVSAVLAVVSGVREVALVLLADMINNGLNVNWVDAGLSDWVCQRIDCSESTGLMQVPGETWSRRKLGTRCGRAIVLQCVSPWWMLQQKGGWIDAAGKETAGCGGTRELGVKQWPATQDGRRASRFWAGRLKRRDRRPNPRTPRRNPAGRRLAVQNLCLSC